MDPETPTPNSEAAFLTPAQLCQRWQLAERTLRDWNKRRVVPFFKLGGKFIRYRLEDVRAFEEKGWRAPRGMHGRGPSEFNTEAAAA